ncbi:Avr9/Cf-9 rapidly elicited protein [Quillaja saponaria]|uniref:Avr9/Cf-9 rapidly elicited protein n=1 Tax=Quillaja saponaria TaxID=32244 RepID=A0AAD7PZ19_QUISA|nr:Avr9/Cf-9 rapidly elicited protein [Quillaja saponaria]
MQVHSPLLAERLWNVLRITFYMIRKGLVSKRKLIMDMNLMMKRGKLLKKSLSNLMSIHHYHHHSKNASARGGYGIQEYEFSCSNSPNPVFFHVSKRKHHFNFPCINTPQVMEEEPELDIALEAEAEQPNKDVVLVPKTPEYTFNFRFDGSDFRSGR